MSRTKPYPRYPKGLMRVIVSFAAAVSLFKTLLPNGRLRYVKVSVRMQKNILCTLRERQAFESSQELANPKRHEHFFQEL